MASSLTAFSAEQGIGFRLGQPDADGQEGARDVAQHGQPGVGDGEEAVRRPGQVGASRASPRSPATDRLSPPRTTASSPSGPYGPKIPAAASAAARSAVAAWFSRRLAKRCWDQPPAALRPCTSLLPVFELTSRGGEPAKTPTA